MTSNRPVTPEVRHSVAFLVADSFFLSFTLSILLRHNTLRRNRIDIDFMLVGRELFIDGTAVILQNRKRKSSSLKSTCQC